MDTKIETLTLRELADALSGVASNQDGSTPTNVVALKIEHSPETQWRTIRLEIADPEKDRLIEENDALAKRIQQLGVEIENLQIELSSVNDMLDAAQDRSST